MAQKWQGVYPAVTTQMKQDQSLDLPATAAHFEALIESGVQGLVVCGSLGENQAMDPEEKRLVVETAVKTSRGRVPVVAGVAETSTTAAIRFARDCAKLGADGFMVMPAMVYKADTREAIAHFRAIGSATELPWMLYNNPLGYPVDITPEILQTFDDVKNLVAVKESSGDPRRITQIRILSGDRFSLFVGVDDLAMEASILGIDGWVAGSGIATPKENQHFWNLTRAGKWDEAREMYKWFTPLLRLDVHTHFVQYIKLAVQEAGLGKEWVRAPRLPIAGEERERVLAIIHEGLRNRPL